MQLKKDVEDIVDEAKIGDEIIKDISDEFPQKKGGGKKLVFKNRIKKKNPRGKK